MRNKTFIKDSRLRENLLSQKFPLLISVCMLTYNHENFIQKAIEGVLMQETTFDFELIISNDHSTDNTHTVITTLVKNHSKRNKIIYINQDYNVGMQSNFISTLNRCAGKYIAICEGDDYWTDPYKLQKQVDYISKNDSCNIVFTDIKCLNDAEGKLYDNWAAIKKENYQFEDLVKHNVIATCSALIRNPGGKKMGQWLSHFKIGDYPLYLLVLQTGYAHFINDLTAVYRQHPTGIFSLKGPANMIENNIEVLQSLKKLPLSKKQLFFVRKNLVRWYYARIARLSGEWNPKETRNFIKQHLKLTDSFYDPAYFFKIMILFFIPKLKSNAFNNNAS